MAEVEYEVYPNPPLRLVACEVRYPFSPRLGRADSILPAFHEQLIDVLPIAEQVPEPQVIIMGPEGPTSSPPPNRSILRFSSRSRTTALTVASTRAVLETSQYERYGVFRPLVKRTIEALSQLGHLVGVERLGLRYIDEIRVPAVNTGPGEWEDYIQHPLQAPQGFQDVLPNMKLESWQGQLSFSLPNHKNVVMRYGALEGSALVSGGPVRLPYPTHEGPYFLIDVDSYWAGSDDVEEFDASKVLTRCDELHRPVRALFESSITERLREDVFRQQGDASDGST